MKPTVSSPAALGRAGAFVLKFGPLIDWAKTVLPILAPISFLISVMLNDLIFEQWGFRFTQVASPTDVLMSGVELFFVLAIQSAVVLIAAAGGHRLGPSLLGRGAAIGAVPAAIAIGVVRMRLTPLVGYSAFLEAAILLLAASGFCFGVLSTSAPSRGVKIGRVAVALLAIAILIAFQVLSVVRTINAGYVGVEDVTATVNIGGSSCDAAVIWLGEHAAVVRCAEGSSSTYRLVSRDSVLPFGPAWEPQR